jgi:hypothetical protein
MKMESKGQRKLRKHGIFDLSFIAYREMDKVKKEKEEYSCLSEKHEQMW